MASVDSPTKGLDALFSKKLENSLLSEQVARKLKLKLVTAKQAPDWLPYKAGGFIIPYFDLHGKPTDFSRFRYLEEPQRKGLDALAPHKALRYVQAPKTLNEVYLPPVSDWTKIAANVDVPIIVTEGELKAACATANSPFACMGLGGVWCFKSTRNALKILPQFKEIKWQGRKVYIAYDSDAVTNVDVMVAENVLAHELTQLGAIVHIARIPPPEGKKQGLDDYMLAHGTDALEQLLDAAVPWAESRELFRMNEEVVYVQNPGLILRLNNMQRMAPRAFVDHAYSTRTFIVKKETEKGTKLEEKSTAREWLKWPNRNEVPAVIYEPGAPRNTPRGINVWSGWGCEPKKGDVTPWKTLLDHLFGKDIESRQWFERWLACPLQNPGVKMYSSPLIWGRQHGTGKSFIGYSMFKLYGKNSTEIKDRDLHSSHNEWAENKQFVLADEITGGEDKRDVADRLKSFITQQELRLNPKYIPSYTVRDCINYYFTSNHPDSFFLEDTDRRFFIHEVLSGPLHDHFYQQLYEPWIGAAGVVGPGAPALFYHLLNLDMGNFDARTRAPMTAAKRDMLYVGRSDLSTWAHTLAEMPDAVLRFDGKVLNTCLWTSEELLNLYDPEGKTRITANIMTRELRRAGFRQVYGGQCCLTETGAKRLWEIRPLPLNVSRDGPGSNYGSFYDKERAPYKEKYK